MSGEHWEGHFPVFYMFWRPWERDLLVFYVAVRPWGGAGCNAAKRPGGSAKESTARGRGRWEAVGNSFPRILRVW